jgi:thiol-disulfide isomerase/thioredoxin
VLAVVGALALAITAGALVAHFGSDFLSDRSANGEGPAVSSAKSGEDSIAMSLHDAPRSLPVVEFEDGDGRTLTLAEFRGRVVLLNIWATWCGPCRREMPTLDRLQAKLGGPDFEVVAVSIDRDGIPVVTEFYAEVGVRHLAKYIDESGDVARRLNTVGVPTTLLIDREGREIGRHLGPAEWDTPEMIAFFRQYLSWETGASWLTMASAGRRHAGPPPVCLSETSASPATWQCA